MIKGNVYIVCGFPEAGKSYFARSLLLKLKPQNVIVFDVNNEWGPSGKYYLGKGSLACYPDLDKFLPIVKKATKKVILIEDATAHLSNRGYSDTLAKLIVGRRHSFNTYILLYHSIRSIPLYIKDVTTTIFLKKTADNIKDFAKLNIDKKDAQILIDYFAAAKSIQEIQKLCVPIKLM